MAVHQAKKAMRSFSVALASDLKMKLRDSSNHIMFQTVINYGRQFVKKPCKVEGGVVVWYKSALHLARKLVNRFSQTSVTFFSEYLGGSLWVQFSFGLSQFVLNPTRIILWELVGGIGKLPKLDKWIQNITPDQPNARWRILTRKKTTEGQYSPRTARASIRTKVVY